MKRLEGKIAVVTGSSSGIGKAIALRFGEEGATVVVAARRIGLCQQTVAKIQQSGGKAYAQQTDITQEEQMEFALNQIEKVQTDLSKKGLEIS